jgi:hypothetical protein
MGILVGVRLHPSLHEYSGSMPDNYINRGLGEVRLHER